MINKEVATVYRGGGRRWFTPQAAANAEAGAAINARCECDNGDEVTPPMVCDYHNDMERYAKIKRRLAKMAINNWRLNNVLDQYQKPTTPRG